MGTWGSGAFENDAACDWSAELEDAEGLSVVLEALARVTEAAEGYLDADDAVEGLVACEVVARLKGNWGVRDAYTEPVDRWVTAHASLRDEAPVEAALAAIDRILTPPSELLALWTDADGGTEWRASVLELRERVRA